MVKYKKHYNIRKKKGYSQMILMFVIFLKILPMKNRNQKNNARTMGKIQ
jgi:hypothetical protein